MSPESGLGVHMKEYLMGCGFCSLLMYPLWVQEMLVHAVSLQCYFSATLDRLQVM